MSHHWNREVDAGSFPIKLKADVANWLAGVSRFLLRHARDIRGGGLAVILRKARASVSLVAQVPLLVAIVLIRALRPLVLIRFGPLRSERIGHFTANTELYLCERDLGMFGRRTIDIFYHSSPICNQQLKKMWDRTLRVWRFARWLDRTNRMLPGGEKHVIPMPSDLDIYGLLKRTSVHLSFTSEEENLGQEALRQLGIPESVPFVCFSARDLAYLESLFPGREWRYHNYRDCSIHNCVPAAEELVRRGYFAVRMGAIIKEALKISNPRIIDYAANGSRTDFMDIFLCARCRFFIGAAGGLNAVPRIYRRPLAFTNVVPLGRDHLLATCGPNNLFIPKKLWFRESGRFLTFRETLQFGADRFLRTEQYEQLGVEVVENTPEEITALVIEMDERLLGTWRTTEEDEELQQRFWSVFDLNHMCDNELLRIGAGFLRRNRDLLD